MLNGIKFIINNKHLFFAFKLLQCLNVQHKQIYLHFEGFIKRNLTDKEFFKPKI